MAWTIVVRSLFYLRGLTRKIQGRNLDLLDFVGQVEVAHEDLAFIPNYGAKEYFSRFFEYARSGNGLPNCYRTEHTKNS